MRIRTGDADDVVSAMNVLDGANLEISNETVSRRIETGYVLVAAGPVVSGVLVANPEPVRVLVADLEPDSVVMADPGPNGGPVADTDGDGVHVDAIAVRRRRRGQGIGTRLLDAASARWGTVSASFDPALDDFYRSVGFETRSIGERCYGERV